MGKHWIVTFIVILAASFLIWGQFASSAAKAELPIPKKERFYSQKILEKVDEVLKKQDKILQELKEIKKNTAPK